MGLFPFSSREKPAPGRSPRGETDRPFTMSGVGRICMARVLDGTAIAAEIKAEVRAEVDRLALQGIRPGLAAVLVGHVPASEIYVRSKVKTCEALGLFSELITP